MQDGIAFTGRRLLEFNDRRLDMLNVKYVVLASGSPEFARLKSTARFSLAYNDGYTAAFENKSVLPRAFMVPVKGVTAFPAIDDQVAFFRNSGFNPQQQFTVSQLPAVLEEPAEEPGSGLPLTRSVEIVGSHVNDVELRASTPETSVLILSQTYYPGWKALVDGQRTDVFQVDLSLTGVRIPPGLHDVQFLFRPTSFQVGAVLSFASAIVLLGLAVWPSTTRRPLRGPPDHKLSVTLQFRIDGILQCLCGCFRYIDMTAVQEEGWSSLDVRRLGAFNVGRYAPLQIR
jgi:hypothetical protein